MKENHIAIEVSRDEHYLSPYLKSLKENWPSLAKDFRHYCHLCNPKTGHVWTWTSPDGQKFFHLILGDVDTDTYPSHMANASRLQSFKQAAKELKKIAESDGVSTIEFPKVGFRFSDHEFSLASMIMKETFLDTEIEVKFV